MKYSTKIITSADDVPPEHVAVTEFRNAVPHAHWATVAKAISEAHTTGTIRACKLVRCLGDLKTGRVFVHRGDAERMLAERYATPAVAPKQERPVQPLAVTSVDSELLAAVARLTRAVEDLTAAMELKAEVACKEAFDVVA